MMIEDFESTFQVTLRVPGEDDEEIETLGGLVNLRAGRMLKVGEVVRLRGAGCGCGGDCGGSS